MAWIESPPAARKPGSIFFSRPGNRSARMSKSVFSAGVLGISTAMARVPSEGIGSALKSILPPGVNGRASIRRIRGSIWDGSFSEMKPRISVSPDPGRRTDHPCRQLGLPPGSPGLHSGHSLVDAGTRPEYSFNFPQLHPESPDLDLVVHAAQKEEMSPVSIRSRLPAGQVAGTVKPPV